MDTTECLQILKENKSEKSFLAYVVLKCKIVTFDHKLVLFSQGFPNAHVCLFLSFPDELLQEKEKYKAISDELDQTFAELAGM